MLIQIHETIRSNDRIQAQSRILQVSWCQFHQRFTYEFFVQTSFLAAFSRYVSALASKLCTKNEPLNVDEIDGWPCWKPQKGAYTAFGHRLRDL
jgi:hypothetical protein